MARSATDELGAIIDQLQRERDDHRKAIEAIDALFGRYGIRPAERKRRGRSASTAAAKPARKPGRRRGRRRFGVSGTQSVLNFIRQAGKSGAASNQISRHWKAEGRSGEPYITLGQLVKAKKLKKQSIPGERGSRYTLA